MWFCLWQELSQVVGWDLHSSSELKRKEEKKEGVGLTDIMLTLRFIVTFALCPLFNSRRFFGSILETDPDPKVKQSLKTGECSIHMSAAASK